VLARCKRCDGVANGAVLTESEDGVCSAQTAARVPGTWRLEAVRATIVPDEETRIEATLREWLGAGASACNLVLTTGGTGFAPRDVTPEATARVVTRRTPQLIELALRAATARGDVHGAALSRGIAGVFKTNGMVVNLPGRPHAARENLAAILPVRKSHARGLSPARLAAAAAYERSSRCRRSCPMRWRRPRATCSTRAPSACGTKRPGLSHGSARRVRRGTYMYYLGTLGPRYSKKTSRWAEPSRRRTNEGGT